MTARPLHLKSRGFVFDAQVPGTWNRHGELDASPLTRPKRIF
jgi:hypothetical protein